MSSKSSDENKSSSMTSETELQLFRQKLREFKYPSMPKRNPELRKENQINNLIITTNLFELKFRNNNYRFTLYSVDILPEVADDNNPLRRIIYSKIELGLPKCFKKVFFTGKNFYCIIDQTEKEDFETFEIQVEVDKINYTLKMQKVSEISFKKVNDFNGGNQKIKSIWENILKNIIMKNPKVIKFHDRTIFEVDPNNIIKASNQHKFYCGYMTSVNITESGLYMLVNNINKLITGKTVLEKMIELRKKYSEEKNSKEEIYNKIKEYFKTHRTVLTVYGSLRSYKISDIDFDKNPVNTNIGYKDKDGRKKTITLINYYRIQYQMEIRDKNQPLIIADNNFLKNQRSLPPNDRSYNIYLIPELVYLTGLEEDNPIQRPKNINRSGIKSPSQKMGIIKGIFNLINSTNCKTITNNQGNQVNLKSPKELSEEWGINLGSNLSFQGTVFPQPKLFFKGDKGNKLLLPENGRYRSLNPFKTVMITNTNIFYVYDKYDCDKNHIDHRKLFVDFLKIFRDKLFSFSNDFHPKNTRGYGIENTNNMENIKKSLSVIEKSENEDKFGILFCSLNMEKYYKELKDFFLNKLHIPTQHVKIKKLLDNKKGRTIMFNLVDQINVKRGGENFFIDFKGEEIIKSGQVFLVIGLDAKKAKDTITYSMTSSKNFNLNKFYTQTCTCEDRTHTRNLILMKMFTEAIEQIMEHSPHCPDYIIIYRQGGNEFRNKILTINELGNFQEVINEYRTKRKNQEISQNFQNTKIYYICCNLKSDLKFFETKQNNSYSNPNSGLVVDEKVTQSSKFEFFLQPQFVNQGTATPSHYQVMYYDKSNNEEDNLKIEKLEKLSFYLTFYYWTWAGAIRVPSFLKMSSTALDFYRKIYNVDSCFFDKPMFI